MQPGVTPGAILELHAARAAGGTAPGSNDPLTTQWADTSGNGNHGTLTGFSGAPWTGVGTPGDPRRLTCDGQDDRVAVAANSGLHPSSLTDEAWILPASSGTAGWWPRIGDDGGQWSVRCSNQEIPNRLCLAVTLAGVDYVWGEIPLGVLAHVAVVFAQGSLQVVGHVNGVSSSRSTSTSSINWSSAGTLFLGNRSGADRGFPGALLEFRRYPFALTPAQVAANYAAGPAWPTALPIIGGPMGTIPGSRIIRPTGRVA